jgi:soluble lytic murein transglycosylase-like protein
LTNLSGYGYNIEHKFYFVKRLQKSTLSACNLPLICKRRENVINPGPKLIINASLVGSLVICALGFIITAGATFPSSKEPQASANLSEIGNPETTIKTNGEIAQEAGKSEASDCQVSKKFPPRILKWCDLITIYAQKQNLSPDLVAAMIWQESGGDPSAFSHSGAVGLMQIMPSEGLAANFQCNHGPCFANRPTLKQLKDPEYNIKYGTRMLANLIKKHGDTRQALKAYGPMNVGYYYADKVMRLYKQYRGD